MRCPLRPGLPCLLQTKLRCEMSQALRLSRPLIADVWPPSQAFPLAFRLNSARARPSCPLCSGGVTATAESPVCEQVRTGGERSAGGGQEGPRRRRERARRGGQRDGESKWSLDETGEIRHHQPSRRHCQTLPDIGGQPADTATCSLSDSPRQCSKTV